MKNKFNDCLRAKYINVENSGSYSTYKIDQTRYIFFEHFQKFSCVFTLNLLKLY